MGSWECCETQRRRCWCRFIWLLNEAAEWQKCAAKKNEWTHEKKKANHAEHIWNWVTTRVQVVLSRTVHITLGLYWVAKRLWAASIGGDSRDVREFVYGFVAMQANKCNISFINLLMRRRWAYVKLVSFESLFERLKKRSENSWQNKVFFHWKTSVIMQTFMTSNVMCSSTLWMQQKWKSHYAYLTQ